MQITFSSESWYSGFLDCTIDGMWVQGCKWHVPDGHQGPRVRCPMCLIFPALWILKKISNHLELIKGIWKPSKLLAVYPANQDALKMQLFNVLPGRPPCFPDQCPLSTISPSQNAVHIRSLQIEHPGKSPSYSFFLLEKSCLNKSSLHHLVSPWWPIMLGSN